MKNKIITILLVLFSFSSVLNAQQRHNQNNVERQQKRSFDVEQFKKKKSDYLIKEAGLTEEEAKAIIPLSNQLMKRKFELNKTLRKEGRDLKEKKSVTNAEYERHMDNVLNVRIKEAELEKEYYLKYKKYISAEKLHKLYLAERDFVQKFVHSRGRK